MNRPFARHAGRIRGQLGSTRLNVLRAVAEALIDLNIKASAIQARDPAIHAVAPPCFELDAQHTDSGSCCEIREQRISISYRGSDAHRALIRRADEPWMPHQRGGPRPSARICAANQHPRQLLEQLAMLTRHDAAN